MFSAQMSGRQKVHDLSACARRSFVCAAVVWRVALFYSHVAAVNCHCKNACTQLRRNGGALMDLRGNANYFKDSQMCARSSCIHIPLKVEKR